jgi:AAA ATPase domain
MISDFQLIKKLYNVFDPSLPLPAGDPAYVDCNGVRGEQDILAGIGKDILLSNNKTCQLYSGHRGAGKSTELLRLKKDLDEKGFFVVYFAADEQDIEPQDVEFSDILLACTRRLLEALKDRGNPTPVLEWLRNLANELKDIIPDISLSGISIEKDIPTFAKITAQIQAEPNQRRKIRNLVNPHTQTLIKALNQFINDARKKLPQEYKDIVVITDNLDRIVPIIDDNGRSNHEEIFIDHNEQLKALDCHLVYTVPISLIYSGNGTNLQDIYADVPLVLPMVMIHTPENQRYERGLEKFKQLLQERVKLVDPTISIVNLFANPDNLDDLCLMSGGHLRNLIILMKEAIKYGDNLPISTKAVQQSISLLRNTYHATVYADEWSILASVFLSKKIQNNNEYRKLLFNRCILEYRYLDTSNTIRCWYDVHPIIRDIDDFKLALQKLTS